MYIYLRWRVLVDVSWYAIVCDNVLFDFYTKNRSWLLNPRAFKWFMKKISRSVNLFIWLFVCLSFGRSLVAFICRIVGLLDRLMVCSFFNKLTSQLLSQRNVVTVLIIVKIITKIAIKIIKISWLLVLFIIISSKRVTTIQNIYKIYTITIWYVYNVL